jgi:hypothetical protein
VRVLASGLGWRGRGQAEFPVPVGPRYGNMLPGLTGMRFPPPQPGPGPAADGQVGVPNISLGADPRAAKMEPDPASPTWQAWGQGQAGVTDATQSFRRYGTLGFNDKMTVKDRHAYWDVGQQRTGLDFQVGNPNNSYNNPRLEDPRPELRLVNRTVSFQIGSDATAMQDDLSRPYTWLGEQGSGWSPVYGGVPGLYQPYGTRGGIPYPVVSPVEQGQPGDGPHLVWSGPPHGLHTQTPWMRRGTAQTFSRFMHTPQTRPVRQDRPSNSPQAGQSYSQTVLPQGASPVRPAAARAGQTGTAPPGGRKYGGGRGWAGRIPGA